MSTSGLPHFSSPRPHSLIEADSDRIHGVNLAIESRLKVPMRAQTLLNEATSAPSRPQWKTLEPLDVTVVEEHVAHGDDALVDLVRMPSKDDALGDNTVQ